MELRSFGRGLVLLALLLTLLNVAPGAVAAPQAQGKPGAPATATPSKAAPATPAAKQPTKEPPTKLPPGVQEPPPTVKSETAQRSGGPDAFGYNFLDSNEFGGPVYDYISAANDVEALSGKDDAVYTDTVPFPLSIYGHDSYTVTISTNGHVHFNSDFCYDPNHSTTNCNYSNLSLPNENAPNGIVAPYWDDLKFGDDGDIYTDVVGTSPSRTYVVEWRNAALFANAAARLNFEVLFHEDSDNIEFQYGTMTGTGADGSSATVGIQNLDRTVGLPYSTNDAGVIGESLAIRYFLQNGTVVAPQTQTKNTAPNTTVVFSGRLQNQTGVQNSYNLSSENSTPGYTSEVNPNSSGTISPGGSMTFTVSVHVPSSAQVGDSNLTTVTLDAQDDGGPNCQNGSCDATMELTTAVTTLGAGFSPGNREGVGSAGATVSYTSTLTNESGMSNAFVITSSGNSWPTTVTPNNTGTLSPGATTTVIVRVEIPSNADLGSRDTVTIDARSTLPTAGAFSGRLVLTTVAGNWATRGFMHRARSRHGLTDYPPNGNVYALGGEGSGNDRNLPVEEFNPASGGWTNRASLQKGVSNVSAATIGTLIYVPGGYDGTDAVTALQTYDPLNDTSATVDSDPLPSGVFGYGLAVLNNKLYLVGGSDMSATSRALYVYDPAAAAGTRWTRKADMPTPRVFLTAAALGGKLYAIGGVRGISDLTDLAAVEVYDPTNDTWTASADLDVALGGAGAIGVPTGQPCGGFYYVVGGGWFTPLADAERFANSGASTALADMQFARRNIGFTFASSRGILVAAGGYGTDYTGYTEVLGCGGTANPQPTVTPGGPPTATPGGSPTVTPTNRTGCDFSDVPTTFWGYEAITWLSCRQYVSGYADGTFRPFNLMTRGQIAKVIVLGQGWDLVNPANPTFSDVPTTNAFYQYIETAYQHGIISGYGDNTFKWANNVTRSQITKIVVASVGWEIDTAGGPHFSDVPPDNPFYGYIETAYNKGLISGYSDGTFHWTDIATRAQVAKIVYIAVH